MQALDQGGLVGFCLVKDEVFVHFHKAAAQLWHEDLRKGQKAAQIQSAGHCAPQLA